MAIRKTAGGTKETPLQWATLWIHLHPCVIQLTLLQVDTDRRRCCTKPAPFNGSGHRHLPTRHIAFRYSGMKELWTQPLRFRHAQLRYCCAQLNPVKLTLARLHEKMTRSDCGFQMQCQPIQTSGCRQVQLTVLQLTKRAQRSAICRVRMNACQQAVDTRHPQQTTACRQVQATWRIPRPVLTTCHGGKRLSKRRSSVLPIDGGVVPSRSVARSALRLCLHQAPRRQVELLQMAVATTANTTASWACYSSQLRPVVAATYPLRRAQSQMAKAVALDMDGVKALRTDDQEF